MQAIWSIGIKHIVAHLNIPKTRKASENLTTSVTKWYRKWMWQLLHVSSNKSAAPFVTLAVRDEVIYTVGYVSWPIHMGTLIIIKTWGTIPQYVKLTSGCRTTCLLAIMGDHMRFLFLIISSLLSWLSDFWHMKGTAAIDSRSISSRRSLAFSSFATRICCSFSLRSCSKVDRCSNRCPSAYRVTWLLRFSNPPFLFARNVLALILFLTRFLSLADNAL